MRQLNQILKIAAAREGTLWLGLVRANISTDEILNVISVVAMAEFGVD